MTKFGERFAQVSIVVFLLALGYILSQIPIWQTEKLTAEQASIVLRGVVAEDIVVQSDQTVKNPSPYLADSWGNNLRYAAKVSPEAAVVVVISNGPDGIPETEDDIVAAATDYNKSRIVGKWLGKKAKQVGDGLIEGLKEKTVFDKATEEQRPETVQEKKKWTEKIKSFFGGKNESQ